MLDQIKAGKKLKKANVVQFRDYTGLQADITAGKITKLEDITPEEMDRLSDEQRSTIQISIKLKEKFKPVEDGADSSSEDEDDWETR